MSKLTASAAGGATPAEGHRDPPRPSPHVRGGAALAILPVAALAAAPTVAGDEEILALSSEVLGMRATRISSCRRGYGRSTGDSSISSMTIRAPRRSASQRPSRTAWRPGATPQLANSLTRRETDRLFDRMMSLPATTQAGRAAKVRALLAHVMPDSWRGAAKELDQDNEMARALLGEFAGMSEAELAVIVQIERGAGGRWSRCC